MSTEILKKVQSNGTLGRTRDWCRITKKASKSLSVNVLAAIAKKIALGFFRFGPIFPLSRSGQLVNLSSWLNA